MSKNFRTIAYWVSLIFSVFSLISAIAPLLQSLSPFSGDFGDGSKSLSGPIGIAKVYSAEAVLYFYRRLFAGIFMFIAIYFGWRLDRNQARELELRTEGLERKVREMEQHLNERGSK